MTEIIIPDKRTYKCGCVIRDNGERWIYDSYCKTHKPNFQKKADKLMHRQEMKIGRGYTKSGKKIADRKHRR